MPRINGYSCVVVLILLWGLWLRELGGQSGEDAQRFFLRLRKNQDEDIVLTLENCEQATCLGGAKTNLQCMCEDEFQEAELLRQQCGTNGRNETGVQMLEQNNMPEILGICARAFANLGYVIDVVNINESDGRANDTESYTTEQLDETIFKLENYAADFWKLLDRTLVGVYLSSNQQRSACKDAYDEWLCSTSLSLYNDSGETGRIKPCLDVCTRVVQQCPYYLPSKFQEQVDSETIYGGYPIFDCPDEQLLRYYKSVCGSDCFIPYHLSSDNSDCIGRSTAIPTHVYIHSYLVLFSMALVVSL